MSVFGSWPAYSMARRWQVLCREFDISRKTGYKIFNRYKDCGLEGLTDRSPGGRIVTPTSLPFQIEKLIVQLKKDKPELGCTEDPRAPETAVIRRFTYARDQHRACGAGSKRSGETA